MAFRRGVSCSASFSCAPHAALLGRPLFVDTLENLPDDSLRKTSCGKKARLLCALAGRFGQRAKLFAPDGLSPRKFGSTQLRAHLFDQLLSDRMTLEFIDDAARAHARRTPIQQAFRETGIRQPAFAFERVQQCVD